MNNKVNNNFDVIVVGCGPAGAQIARNLSSDGKNVLVLDHRNEIGNKLCTGIVGIELYNHYPEVEKFIYSKANSAKIFNDLELQETNPNVKICSNSIETFQNSSAVIILTEWDEFKEINFEEAYKVMKKPAWFFDGRNILDLQKLKDIGFEVQAIGKSI